MAAVRHAQGDPGLWQVWYWWPSIYFAYRDGAGIWWLGYWQMDEALRLPGTIPASE